MTWNPRHGYDGPHGFWAYGDRHLLDEPTMHFTPGFLKEPRDGWTVEGFTTTLLGDIEGVLIRHINPVRVWRCTGGFDAPYPGLFGYTARWPD